jgi:hypothetical protein
MSQPIRIPWPSFDLVSAILRAGKRVLFAADYLLQPMAQIDAVYLANGTLKVRVESSQEWYMVLGPDEYLFEC